MIYFLSKNNKNIFFHYNVTLFTLFFESKKNRVNLFVLYEKIILVILELNS